VPYDRTYLLADWPVGSLVRDVVDLDVPLGPPPGRYTLHVSIYPAEGNGPALPVHDLDSDQLMGLIVPIGEVTVARPQSPPRTADLSIPRTAHRRYGDLALLGHNLQGGSYERGDAIYLDLHWRALRAPRRNERLTLQLIDAKGTVQASRKIAPAQGYPTSSWQKGEYALGKHRFRIPLELPAGVYGLWLAPDQDSLPASIWPWSNQRVQLGTLSIREGDDERDFVVPPVQHKLHAILDDQVELLGYDLAEGNVRPGESVSCTLYWRGLQEMSRDYTVFTHLVAPDGTTWGQWDNEPQQGRSPTTRWVPGQVVADTYEIPLSADTPEGVLTLYAGMYDRLTMTRLPLLGEEGTAGGDAIVVTQIQVVAGAD